MITLISKRIFFFWKRARMTRAFPSSGLQRINIFFFLLVSVFRIGYNVVDIVILRNFGLFLWNF